jgi:hypothetical protein
VKNTTAKCSTLGASKGGKTVNSGSAETTATRKKPSTDPKKGSTTTSLSFLGIMAIDPGMLGGIVMRHPNGEVLSFKMPDTLGDLWDRLQYLAPMVKGAVMENVGGYVPGNSGPASVKFARHMGNLEMALYGLRISCTRVTPGTWMKSLGVPAKLEKAERKRWIKDYVQKKFPGHNITLWNADAYGMLLWNDRPETRW